MSSPLIVAIDGPSGVGKSTVARMLAARLEVPVLDTGAMYRAVGLEVLRRGVDPDDADAVLAVALAADLEARLADDGTLIEVLLGGVPLGAGIRTQEVSEVTSRASVHPAVRDRMVALQRRWGARYGAVVEGRDIATVVFPDTPHRFFLDAAPEVRAARRQADLAAAGERSPFGRVLDDIDRRDRRDRDRGSSPLVRDDRYRLIDTSSRTPEEVVEAMVEAVRAVSE